MDQEVNPKVLFGKLSKILGTIETVKKSGYNKHLKYPYATEADIFEAVREKLAKEKVFIFSSVEDQNKVRDDITSVKTKHTFACGDSGATFSVYSQGTGQCKQDKGVFKAITGAAKYFVMKNFLVSAGDDPENDGGQIVGAPAVAPTGKSFANRGKDKIVIHTEKLVLPELKKEPQKPAIKEEKKIPAPVAAVQEPIKLQPKVTPPPKSFSQRPSFSGRSKPEPKF